MIREGELSYCSSCGCAPAHPVPLRVLPVERGTDRPGTIRRLPNGRHSLVIDDEPVALGSYPEP